MQSEQGALERIWHKSAPPGLCRLLDRGANGSRRSVASASAVTDFQSTIYLSGALVKTS